VHILQTKGEWCEVEVPEQMVGYDKGHVLPYRGWMEKQYLQRAESCCCQKGGLVISPSTRKRVIETAASFLGRPYVWGGLGIPGFDCSGLVYESFKLGANLFLPRNSCDQCCVLHSFDPSTLVLPADLIFIAQEGKKVSHVLLLTGDGDELIEATPQDGAGVRHIRFKDRFAIPLHDVRDGMVSNGLEIFFRRCDAEGC
jgi:hypothetical protein